MVGLRLVFSIIFVGSSLVMGVELVMEGLRGILVLYFRVGFFIGFRSIIFFNYKRGRLIVFGLYGNVED